MERHWQNILDLITFLVGIDAIPADQWPHDNTARKSYNYIIPILNMSSIQTMRQYIFRQFLPPSELDHVAFRLLHLLPTSADVTASICTTQDSKKNQVRAHGREIDPRKNEKTACWVAPRKSGFVLKDRLCEEIIKSKGWHRPCNGKAIRQEAKDPTASLKDYWPVYHCGQCWFVGRQKKYMASDKCCRGWTRKNEVTNRNWLSECKGYLEDWCREDEESIQSYTMAGLSSFMQIKLHWDGDDPINFAWECGQQSMPSLTNKKL